MVLTWTMAIRGIVQIICNKTFLLYRIKIYSFFDNSIAQIHIEDA